MNTELEKPASGNETPVRTFSPYLDILEKTDAFEVIADVPGATAEGVEITVEKNVLTLRVKVGPTVSEDLPLIYQEYEVGDYEATLRISEKIDVDKIDAVLKDGIITLTLPKAAEAKPRQILVKAA